VPDGKAKKGAKLPLGGVRTERTAVRRGTRPTAATLGPEKPLGTGAEPVSLHLCGVRCAVVLKRGPAADSLRVDPLEVRG